MKELGLTDLYERNTLPLKRNEVEQDGVRMVSKIIAKDYDWIFFEHGQRNDYGIDAFAEIVDERRVTGKLIAIQIKAGDSYFKEETIEGFKYRGEKKHLAYWINYSLPVILILCNVKTEVCYWAKIEKDSIEVQDKGWTIIVNKNNILNMSSIEQLKEIADNRSDYQKRLDSLLIARPWMDQIIEGNRVLIEAEEWINKCSGRGTLKIIIEDNSSGNNVIDKDYGNVYFPMIQYEILFPKLFPWAEINVDDEFYDSYEMDEYILENGYKDEDTGDISLLEEQEDDYYKEREDWPKIRPYEIEQGELAKYRLELNISDFGKSFYNVDSYLKGENSMRFLLKDEATSKFEEIDLNKEEEICEGLEKTLEICINLSGKEENIFFDRIQELSCKANETIKYLKWRVVCGGESPITYMENELVMLHKLLSFNCCFNNKYIEKWKIVDNNQSVKLAKKIIDNKNYMIQYITTYFDMKNKIYLNIDEEKVIDERIFEKLDNTEKGDIIEYFNKKCELENNCPELNQLKVEREQYYQEIRIAEDKLENIILGFFSDYDALLFLNILCKSGC